MSDGLETKTVTYFSLREYHRGREKMWAEGWVIADRRIDPGQIPTSIGSGWLDLVLFPVLWTLSKTQPDDLYVVTYVREKHAE